MSSFVKARAVLTAELLLCASAGILATNATAKEVEKTLAASPAAVLSVIDDMNLTPLSDQAASELRGGQLTLATPFPVNGSRLAKLRYPACMAALRSSGRILPMCVGLY